MQDARAEGQVVYVHCTAGLGRAPAVGIAALYWFTDMQLEEAYSYLTGIRPCGPNRVSACWLAGSAGWLLCYACCCLLHLLC